MIRWLTHLSLASATALAGCVSIGREPLPTEPVAVDSQFSDFVGTYRFVDDVAADAAVADNAARTAETQIVLRISEAKILTLYRSDSTSQKTDRIDLQSKRSVFRNGRLQYRPRRFKGAVILPGLAFSDDDNEMYLDADRNLVLVQSSREFGLMLFCLPFYESRRSVDRFARTAD
jgi:hypothetical protein